MPGRSVIVASKEKNNNITIKICLTEHTKGVEYVGHNTIGRR